jgi:hypothetical protein
MPTLTLVLERGFTDDWVVVNVDGRELLKREGVTTRLLLGRAEAHALDVPAGQVEVEVALPRRDLASSTALDAERTPHLRASVEEGRLGLHAQVEPSGYA